MKDHSLLNPSIEAKSDADTAAHTHGISDVVRKVGVSTRQLYYWESLGVIKPMYIRFGVYAYRRYTNSDLELLCKIKNFLDDGYMLRTAIEKAKGQNK